MSLTDLLLHQGFIYLRPHFFECNCPPPPQAEVDRIVEAGEGDQVFRHAMLEAHTVRKPGGNNSRSARSPHKTSKRFEER